MTRKETLADGVELYLGDCREILPTLQADLVLTDPPFGVRDDAWDNMDAQEFARFSMEWIATARKSAPELISFCTADSAIKKLAEMIYPRVRPMFWFKPPGSQYPGARERTRWFAYELIVHCYEPETWSVVEPKTNEVGRLIAAARKTAGLSKGAVDIAIRGKKTGLCYRWEEAACLPTPDQAAALAALIALGDDFGEALEQAYLERNRIKGLASEKASEFAAGRTDVLMYRTVTQGIHPCEKPVSLLMELIEDSGSNYTSIIDPFMGSGTTGVAAIRLGRKFVGIESEPKYFATACKRIQAALDAPDMFVEPPAKTKQEAFEL